MQHDDVTVILTRHTETDDNSRGIYSGRARDVGLNDLGRRQAEQLRDGIVALGCPVTAIHCSTLRRTRQTALPLAQHLGLEPTQHADLDELALGQVEGLTKDEAQQRFPGDQYRTTLPGYDFRPVGGESEAELVARVLRGLAQVVAAHARDPFGSTVVVISHGTAMRSAHAALELPWSVHRGGFRPHALPTLAGALRIWALAQR